MKGRYPRTISEFAVSQRVVLVWCSACQRRRLVPPDVLEAMFGGDFDLYQGFAALGAELRCEQCGKKHRLIIFRDTTEYTTGPVSFEDAINRDLERRAYIAVRDVGKPEAVRGARRRRR
ncbi:MAG: hypothetical protein ABL962_08925 [Fimbriimonadaceae bacterium]